MLSERYASIAAALLEPRSHYVEDDVLVARFVDEKLAEREADLFHTKWFDYRFISPMKATRLYIEAYTVIYRQFYGRYFDRSKAELVAPPTLDNVMEGLASEDKRAKTRFAGLNRGRMCADMLGMPYEIYIDLAFEQRLRLWNRPYMPSPAHLFGDEQVVKIAERWEELQETDLFVSEHPAYLVQNDCGTPGQAQHRLWLLKQADKRANPVSQIVDFIESDLLIDRDVAVYRPDMHERVVQALH